MTYVFPKNFKEAIVKAENWLVREYGGVRAGRATPAILDTVLVEVYGARMPIVQLASVGVEDAKVLRIIPWDTSNTKNIEKAIMIANLGVSISVDGKGLRVSFPQLTTERRIFLVKVAKEKLEESRIIIRTARDEVWSEIQQQEREGEISEDDKFRAKEEMQKIVDDGNRKLEQIFGMKEKEIMD